MIHIPKPVPPYYNLRMRYLMLAVLALVSAPALAQNHDTRLMTLTEYKALLAQIDAELPIWEAALKKVDHRQGEYLICSRETDRRLEDTRSERGCMDARMGCERARQAHRLR